MKKSLSSYYIINDSGNVLREGERVHVRNIKVVGVRNITGVHVRDIKGMHGRKLKGERVGNKF